MKRFCVIALFLILGSAQELCGMLRRSDVALVSAFSLMKPTCWFAQMNGPRNASLGLDGAWQYKREACILSARQPIYIPFDRHTAAKILRERREREWRGVGRKH